MFSITYCCNAIFMYCVYSASRMTKIKLPMAGSRQTWLIYRIPVMNFMDGYQIT